ncbi:MAG: hypothetical protein V2A78_06815 [bacterium]
MTEEEERRESEGEGESFGLEKKDISTDEEYFAFQEKLSEEEKAVGEYGQDLAGEGGGADRHSPYVGYDPPKILMFFLVFAFLVYYADPFWRVEDRSKPPWAQRTAAEKPPRPVRDSAEMLMIEGRVLLSDDLKPEQRGGGYVFRGFGIIVKFEKSLPFPLRFEPVVTRDGFFRETVPLPREFSGIRRIAGLYAEMDGYRTRVFSDVDVHSGLVKVGEIKMERDTTRRGRSKGRCL